MDASLTKNRGLNQGVVRSENMGPRFMMIFIALAMVFWYVMDLTREDILNTGAEKSVIHEMKSLPVISRFATIEINGNFSRWARPLVEVSTGADKVVSVKDLRVAMAERFDRAVEAARDGK